MAHNIPEAELLFNLSLYCKKYGVKDVRGIFNAIKTKEMTTNDGSPALVGVHKDKKIAVEFFNKKAYPDNNSVTFICFDGVNGSVT